MDTFKLQSLNLIVALVVVLALGLVGGYWYGGKQAYQGGYDQGYAQAETDAKKLQAESAKKAAELASKTANPFQTVNPLAGVESNPFEKTKKILNPFQ